MPSEKASTDGHPIVVVRQTDHQPLFVQLRDRLELGRECNGLLLADPHVSRRHVALSGVAGTVLVEDLGSTNGTYLDGIRVNESATLGRGSVLRFGSTTVELVESSAPAVVAPDGRPTTIQGDGEALVRPSGPQGLRETGIEAVARHMSARHDEIKALELHDGTVTIVFSDIESSTESAISMGDTAWIAVLGKHNTIIRRCLRKWGGTEVKNQGDGFMLTFPGARRALACMSEVQQDLQREDELDPEHAIRIRVGVHTGEVMVEDGDIFGKHVIVASRVANIAHGGEILVSSLVHEITSARGDLEFGEPRRVSLKGIAGETTVYPLHWESFRPT